MSQGGFRCWGRGKGPFETAARVIRAYYANFGRHRFEQFQEPGLPHDPKLLRATFEILLLGAGHANLLAAPLLRQALPGARITLIDAAPQASYSGMFPGVVARFYAPEDCRIDLTRFAARHGVRFLHARVAGLDPPARETVLSGGRRIGYDLAALDVGSHAAMPEIDGFSRHAVPIKPLDGFFARLGDVPADAIAAIIGGGVAGAEIALALSRRRSAGPSR